MSIVFETDFGRLVYSDNKSNIEGEILIDITFMDNYTGIHYYSILNTEEVKDLDAFFNVDPYLIFDAITVNPEIIVRINYTKIVLHSTIMTRPHYVELYIDRISDTLST